jgi:tetratricopeptide (TPR) repeat protein
MALDPYSPCPCGSGKKFKWCCQPFYGEIERAYQQQANGQHETALKIMDDLTGKYPQNAEVWGKRAELYWENRRLDEAERSVDRALEVNPNYAFAYFLRGMFRHDEGEVPGALNLYRRAAEHCSSDAADFLAEIYAHIAQAELHENRPLAAHAAYQISLRLQPDNQALQEHFQRAFGEDSRFPALCRREYAFKKPVAAPGRDRRAAWDRALAGARTGQLADASRAFERLTSEDQEDAAAFYNHGLVLAWLGDNRRAIDAFDDYVDLETDEEQAAAAWALTEVLRLGEGLTEISDHVDHAAIYRIQDPQALGQALSGSRLLTEVSRHEHVIGGAWLDREVPPASENLALFQVPRVLAYLLIIGSGSLHVTSPDAEMLEKARHALEPLLGNSISGPQFEQRPQRFETLKDSFVRIRFPPQLDPERARHMIDDYFQQVFEEQWLHRPLQALNLISPLDSVGHAGLRKKVRGVVEFLEEVAHTKPILPYDFDRLRHKLGLPTRKPLAEVLSTQTRDLAALNAAELAVLDAGSLDETGLEQAFQAAVRLDARELASTFARGLVGRPPHAEQRDRLPYYQHLSQQAADQHDFPAAHSWLDEGLKYDCEHNEGRRSHDYELRRAQVHLRAGEPDRAFAVYQRQAQRFPSDVNLLGTAAEAMLSAGLPSQAAQFAEQGLARARQSGDRDRGAYFEELLAAAKKR